MSEIAVVTGAARGIGFAVAEELVARGYRVLVTDLDAEAAQAAAERLGHGCWAVAQDVADLDGHRAVADEAATRGRLTVWVNNAGVLFAGDAWTHTDAQVETILDVNIRGVIGGCRAAIDAMEDGGRILNIASISALTPVPGLALYAATKAAVLSFTTSLQGDLDHAGLEIRVRALCPDVVGTAMVEDVAHDSGAAMLFSGPAPIGTAEVARAGLDLLDSHQVFRVIPRWRGPVARSAALAPALGLKALAAMRTIGDRRQRRNRSR